MYLKAPTSMPEISNQKPNVCQPLQEVGSGIESKIIRLSSLTSSLSSIVDRITESLNPVLRQSPVDPKCDGSADIRATTPLGEDLDELGFRLSNILSNLSALHENIDL